MKQFLIALIISLASFAQAQERIIDTADTNFVARQLLQIALMDDPRIDYSSHDGRWSSLDGIWGPKTIAAIKKWQDLEGIENQEPLDQRTVCPLIDKGIRWHGSGSKRPAICR